MADLPKLERIYTIPLRKAFDYLRTRRTERAVKLVREFVAKHMKVELDNVRISEGVNSMLWRDSIEKPPRRIKVRVVREGENARAWVIGEEEAVKKAAEEAKKAGDAKAKKGSPEKKPEVRPEAKKEEKKDAGDGKGAAEKKEAAAPKPASSIPTAASSPKVNVQVPPMQGGRNQI